MATPNKNTHFYKLFLSFSLVFLIPAVVISSAIFQVSDRIIREEIQSNNILLAQTASYNLGKTLESFSIVGTSAAYSGFGHALNLENENTAATQLIRFLNRSSLSYIFVQDIFMIYEDCPYVYSGQSSYTRENFLKYISYRDLSPKDAYALLEQPSRTFTLQVSGLPGSITINERDKDYILYCIPCTNQDVVIGSTAFLIDVDALNRFLGNGGEDSCLYLLDREGTILNSDSASVGLPQSFRDAVSPDELRSGLDQKLIHADGYVYTAGTIMPGVLSLVNMTTGEKALQRLHDFRDLTLSILLAALLLGAICVITAYLMGRRDFIKVTSYYEKELKEVLPLRQKEILYSLIEGKYICPTDFEIQCEESGLTFNAPLHYCVILQAEERPLTGILSEIFGRENICTYCFYIQKTDMKSVYLIGTQEELPAQPCFFSGKDYYLFLSRPATRILEVNMAYTEVLSVMYMHKYSHQDTMPEDDQYQKRLSYYDGLLSRIAVCLSRDDSAGLEQEKEILLRDLQNDFIPFGMRMRLLLRLFISFPSTFQIPFGINDIAAMTSVEEAEGYIRTLFDCYIASLEEKKETAPPAALILEDIKQYIESNYTDPMFSLQLIADHFHVSSSYLSWYFKQKNGNTVLDYITGLKMNLAASLLRQNQSLQEISLQVGYINVSSFIRRFKQTMGMTPGEYKKQHQEP